MYGIYMPTFGFLVVMVHVTFRVFVDGINVTIYIYIPYGYGSVMGIISNV